MNAPYRAPEQVTSGANALHRAPEQVTAGVSLTAYWPFIDGLRAVSILAVVLYHVGVPHITGGYIGVDVFFVISGFLIISQIVEGLRRGSFTFGGFWARRALRILPPNLLVLVFTVVIAPFVLIMPDEFRDFAKEARDAPLMLINHLLLNQQGYFDTASDAKPLLHLWSLAVEEQFYLVAPLLLGLLWWLPYWLKRPRLRSPLLFWAALAVFVGSLAGCILLTTAGGRNYAFYLTALRAWEFVAGGAVGFLLPIAFRLPRAAHAWLAAAGLAAILGAAVFYQPDTLYPSWRVMLPVFGAVAVILAGLAEPKAPAIRLLATPPMVWIGLVSYSWYLWHWPLLVFERVHNFGERDFATDIGFGLLSLCLAAATYYLLERPIRRWRQGRGKKPGWQSGWRPVFVGVAVAVVAAIGGFQVSRAYTRHYESIIASNYAPVSKGKGRSCDLMTGTAEDCRRMANGRPVGLLIGDSQMMYATNALALDAEANGIFAVSAASPGCAAFLHTRLFIVADANADARCENGRKNVSHALSSGAIKPSYAVLYSLWQRYGLDTLLGLPDSDKPAADQTAAFTASLKRTVEELRSLGVQRILIIGPTPIFPRSVPGCLFRADNFGHDRATDCGLLRAAPDDALRHETIQRIVRAIAGIDGVRLVDPTDDFCDAVRCLPYSGNEAFFADIFHPGDTAMKRMMSNHRANFDWIMALP